MEYVVIGLLLICAGALLYGFVGLINPHWVFAKSRPKAFIMGLITATVVILVTSIIAPEPASKADKAGQSTQPEQQ